MKGTLGRKDALAMAILATVGAGIPLWLVATAGAIGLPTIDDWVYMRGALSLFQSGSVEMPGHTAAAIGQVVLVQPLLWLSGGRAWAFTAFGLLMTVIAVEATYFFARRFVGTGSAFLVVLLLELVPGFAREATSFMTDVPAYALVVVSLLLGARWIDGNSRRATIAASLAIGLIAVTIREYALAAPVAVLAVAWVRVPARERIWLASVTGLFAAGTLIVLAIGAAIPGRGIPTTPHLGLLLMIGPAFATFAAFILPALVFGVARRMAQLSPFDVLLGAGLVGLVFVFPYGVLLGFLWLPNGVMGNALLIGIRDPLFGSVGWDLTNRLASFAAVLLAGLLFGQARRAATTLRSSVKSVAVNVRILGRHPNALLVGFLAAYCAELMAFVLVVGLSDRYLIPMVPVAGILLLQRRAEGNRLGPVHAAAHASLAWIGISAFVIAANSFAYDSARWRAGEVTVLRGYDASTIDAGYEWVGFHAIDNEAPIGPRDFGLTWYDDLFMASRPCAVVSNKPLEVSGYVLLEADPTAYYSLLLLGNHESLYLYGATSDGCPRIPTALLPVPAPS